MFCLQIFSLGFLEIIATIIKYDKEKNNGKLYTVENTVKWVKKRWENIVRKTIGN